MKSVDGRVQPIFNDALEYRAGPERESYIAAQCGSNGALRNRVEVLLRAYEEAGDFLAERGAQDPSLPEPDSPVSQ